MFFKAIICSISILFISNIGQASSFSDGEIIIGDGTFKEGSDRIIDYNQKCIEDVKSTYHINISVVYFNSICINLYKEINCTGDYIIIKPGDPGRLSSRRDFDKNIGSIGPCYPDCHPNNIETVSPNKSTLISLYSYTRFRGLQEDLILHNNCVKIPRSLKERVHSIKTKEPLCIQLYEFPDCTGQSSQLLKGSPFNSNLAKLNPDHSFFFMMDNWTSMLGAVSLCGYRCTISNSTEQLEVSGNKNSVFLYSMLNYRGMHEEITLGNGCHNLPMEWEGEALSLKTFGNQCVTIYELIGCSSSGKVLDLNDSDENIKRNLTIAGFDRLIRSVKFCGDTNVIVNNTVHFTDSESGDCSNSQTVNFTESESGDCSCSNSETSQVYFYLLFVILIICLLVSFLVIFRLWKISQNYKELLRAKYIEQQYSQAVYNSEHCYANLL